jgi:hypothetical protein
MTSIRREDVALVLLVLAIVVIGAVSVLLPVVLLLGSASGYQL